MFLEMVERNIQILVWHLRLPSLTSIASKERSCRSNNLKYRLNMTFLKHISLACGQRLEGHIMLESTFLSLMSQGDLLQIYIVLLSYYCITNIDRMALACESRTLIRESVKVSRLHFTWVQGYSGREREIPAWKTFEVLKESLPQIQLGNRLP